MISLSLCLIVRDEEHTLGRCLDSMAGIADEIIVLDTGSVDATKSVAIQHGARVFDFTWIDDFAAARNASFAHAEMDYIMWLDADDVLREPDRRKLTALKATLDPGVDAVSMVYHTSFDEAGNVTSSTRRFRIVRKSMGFQWHGIVHEDLSTERMFHFLDSDIVVTHQKPTGDGLKSDRNLSIYERHIAAGRELSLTDIFHYGRELQMHERYEQAIQMHERFLAGNPNETHLKLFTLHNLGICYHHVGDLDGEWQCTLRSFDLDVPQPEFSCRVAERFVRREQYSQAIYWYQQALTPASGSDSAWSVQLHPYRTWLPHKELGLCYYKVGNLRLSLKHNRKAQEFLPNDPDIQTNIELLQRLIAQG